MSAGTAEPGSFRLGVNYLPPRSGMAWLRPYQPKLTRSHFRRMACAGFDSVRVFLPWEDAQPSPGSVDPRVLNHLVDVADAAAQCGVELIVTLFTGHMSGVNWIPRWATGPGARDRRFRVVAGGEVQDGAAGLRNWYSDPEVVKAQERLAGSCAAALAGHPALWAWDLGNENSNCTVPAHERDGLAWLERMTAALRRQDPGTPVTIGTHMEDLEEDRAMGPAEAARYCDFVCMHGYPIYANWARGPTDHHLLSFLALITRWLAGGKDVLFEEFGLPTASPGQPGAAPLVAESAAARYTGDALDALRAAGCTGALLWCFADYEPALHDRPPLDLAIHERSFGLWRADGAPKPSLAQISLRMGQKLLPPPETGWLDIAVEQFQAARRTELLRLYARYRAGLQAQPQAP
ncbi:MAG: cellulase family glycosylhydrolase [Actinomycetota bacterium]